jgi:small conductance mechanosensitive channel
MNLEQYLTQEYITTAIDFALKAVGALVVLVLAWMVASWLKGVMLRRFERVKFDETLGKFFANMVRYVVIVLAVLSCLQIFGVDTTSFAAVLAAAGFAIGLALQGTLQNFSAGVMLLAFRPFKVGDVVNVAGQLGKVDSIALFTTTMDTFDNRRIILPNSEIFGATIENISFHDTRRVDVNVGTAYEADIDQTWDLLKQVAQDVEGRLPDQDGDAILLELGDSSVNWQLRVWTQAADFFPTKQRLTRNVKVALDEAGISIPYPQMDVHHNTID